MNSLKAIIDSMSIEQKVGQMFLVSFIGAHESNKLISFLKEGYFGNVLLYADNIQNANQLKELTYALKRHILANTKIPPFIAVDHEGGNVIRLHDKVTAIPGSMTIAAAKAVDETYEIGKCMATELLALGINVNFAPVLDVNTNPLNPIINSRSYSDSPDEVFKYALGVIKGMQNNGLLACGKHFPGHGDTFIDSHFGLPKVAKTKQEIYNQELLPFIKAINSDLHSIMTAHILYPQLESSNVPATMSKKILTDLLRAELGFKGLIFTDSMQMAAIRKYYGIANACVEAIKAGVDIVLSGINDNDDEIINSQIEAYHMVLHSVKSGEIPISRVNESVKRIIEFKHKYNLFNSLQTPTPNFSYNFELSKNISERAITLVKDEKKLLPINNESVFVISSSTKKPLGGNFIQRVEHNTFAYKVASALNGSYKVISMQPTKEEIEEILEVVTKYQKIIIATNNVNVYPEQQELVNRMLAKNDNVIAIAVCSPYDILHYATVPTYVCTYEYNSTTVSTLNSLLTGAKEFKGKLPVNLNNFI